MSDAPRTRKGLRKAKKYDWKDSNLALFGSDTERQVKKDSAEQEPAWAGLGNEVGIKIWRIVKFEVTAWPTEDYGSFFSGDSYIILNTYKPNPDSEELAFDVHFWIGKYSSQDEYGTAAYKTVELDTFLDDRAVQHREVQGHESELFQSYFPEMVIMEGGAETGFRHVKPEEYPTRLLHFHGKRRNVQIYEKTPVKASLRSDDVFILDIGETIYQFNGTTANKDERMKRAPNKKNLKSDDVYLLDKGLELYQFNGNACNKDERMKKAMRRSEVTSDDVYILDKGNFIFQFNGNASSKDEKFKAMQYMQKLRSDRNGRPQTEVLDEDSTESTHEFYKTLEEEEDDEDDDSGIDEGVADDSSKLYVLSDASGSLELQLKAEGTFTKADLASDDVNFVDTGKELFVYVGSGASVEERRNGLPRAHAHLKSTGRTFAGIHVLGEGKHNAAFEAVFAEAA